MPLILLADKDPQSKFFCYFGQIAVTAKICWSFTRHQSKIVCPAGNKKTSNCNYYMLLYLAWITIGWQETIKAEGVKIFARNTLGSGRFVGLGLSSVHQIIYYIKQTKLKVSHINTQTKQYISTVRLCKHMIFF